MATLDRIDPGYTPWTLSSSGLATAPEVKVDAYGGRHRRADAKRRLWIATMFYRPKHRAR